jgi:hypothetical protein
MTRSTPIRRLQEQLYDLLESAFEDGELHDENLFILNEREDFQAIYARISASIDDLDELADKMDIHDEQEEYDSDGNSEDYSDYSADGTIHGE